MKGFWSYEGFSKENPTVAKETATFTEDNLAFY